LLSQSEFNLLKLFKIKTTKNAASTTKTTTTTGTKEASIKRRGTKTANATPTNN